MGVFTKFIAFVKGLSLPVKIISGVVIVGAIGGGTTAIVLLNQNKPAAEPEPTAASSENKKEETKKEKKQTEEKKEENQSKSDDSTESKQDTQEAAAEAPKAETKTNIEESKTEPVKTEPTKTEETPAKPTETPEPIKTEEAPATPTADYNLNDQYVYADYTVTFLDCKSFEETNFTKRYFSIAKYAGTGSEADSLNISKAGQDAQTYGYCLGGIGARDMTWAEVVAAGKALDEAACAQYGLSCARW